MPYDLFVTVFLLGVVIVFFVYLILSRSKGRLTFLRTIGALALVILVVGSIISLGHTKLNRQHQLISSINNLKSSKGLSAYSDQSSISEIVQSHHPLNVIIDDEQPKEFNMYSEDVEINGKSYQILIADYTYPLSWTPFETWKINTVTKKH